MIIATLCVLQTTLSAPCVLPHAIDVSNFRNSASCYCYFATVMPSTIHDTRYPHTIPRHKGVSVRLIKHYAVSLSAIKYICINTRVYPKVFGLDRWRNKQQQ